MDPLKPIFDKASTALLEMNKEIEELKIKFGERSKLVTARTDQLTAIIEMQEVAVTTINELRQICKLSEINGRIKDQIIFTLENNLSYESMAHLFQWEGKDRSFSDISSITPILTEALSRLKGNG